VPDQKESEEGMAEELERGGSRADARMPSGGAVEREPAEEDSSPFVRGGVLVRASHEAASDRSLDVLRILGSAPIPAGRYVLHAPLQVARDITVRGEVGAP
jgi:hypothetical protein